MLQQWDVGFKARSGVFELFVFPSAFHHVQNSQVAFFKKGHIFYAGFLAFAIEL
jgi:hypothetical protein